MKGLAGLRQSNGACLVPSGKTENIGKDTGRVGGQRNRVPLQLLRFFSKAYGRSLSDSKGGLKFLGLKKKERKYS